MTVQRRFEEATTGVRGQYNTDSRFLTTGVRRWYNAGSSQCNAALGVCAAGPGA